ncbi:unnamed protein product [Lepidochelys olivacea]
MVGLQLPCDPMQPRTFYNDIKTLSTFPYLFFSTSRQHLVVVIERKVLDKFPRSQHQPCLITRDMQIPPTSSLQKLQWNFQKAIWDLFQSKLESLVGKDSESDIQKNVSVCNKVLATVYLSNFINNLLLDGHLMQPDYTRNLDTPRMKRRLLINVETIFTFLIKPGKNDGKKLLLRCARNQTRFRRRRCIQDQVLCMTRAIENTLEKGKRIGAVLVDLTTASNTVWCVGLTARLLHIIPCRLMVQFIQEIIHNQSFILQVKEKISCLKELHSGLPQGSILPLCSIYTRTTFLKNSLKTMYADDICIGEIGNNFHRSGGNLRQNMDTLSTYFQQ